MPSAQYHFLSRWRVVGTIEEVSAVLENGEDLPRWWPSVYLEAERLRPGGEHGIGGVVRVVTKGFLPYTLAWLFRVTESRHPHGFTIEASGDFLGKGVWAFEQQGAWVDITYDWRIAVEKRGVKELSPLLRPVFAANHRWAMRRGEESLKLELARRRAATEEERRRVPAPPGPSRLSGGVVAGGATVVAIVALMLFGRRRGRGRR